MPSDYYRFLLSGSRNRFLSTDLQSAFWKRLGKEPSLGFPMDLTNLHALLNDQKAGSHSELTSHQLALRLPHPRQQHLTDGLGSIHYALTGAGTGAVSGVADAPPLISPTLNRAKRRIEIFSPSLAIAWVIISPIVTLSSLI